MGLYRLTPEGANVIVLETELYEGPALVYSLSTRSDSNYVAHHALRAILRFCIGK